jgi:outer membrane lipoprotein-sorting protein
MIRKVFVAACAVVLGFLASGCHTVSGAVAGAKQDYKEVKKADIWLQENLW